jgi:hypothetical protein
VADWTREFLALGEVPSWVCVCSDETAGNLERDEFVGEVYDTGLPTFTDPREIAERLRAPGELKVVFTTYQSSDRLAAAAKLAKIEFDLVICDEAHRTAGIRSKTFAALLHNRTLKARCRLFMTATERRVTGDVDVFSMDDHEADYGARFFTMSFKEAIDLGIICDYEILTIAVSDKDIRDLIARNRLLNLDADLDEAEARAVATGIALKKVYAEHGATHAVSFHSSIKAAYKFREQQDVLNCLEPVVENFHISSHKSAGERKQLINQFKEAPRALITNARCLTEGIDVPAIDCVVFADPRQSAIDIVQASGRAMRKSKETGKTKGYIVVPLVVPEDKEFAVFAETTAFKAVVRIISALSVSDDRIVDELRAIHCGKISSGNIFKNEGTVPVGMHMTIEEFANAISTKIWERTRGVTVFGVKYSTLVAACLAHKVNVNSILRRMERENETAEQAIIAIKKFGEGITVFGVNYPNLKAACRVYKVNRGSVASRLEQQGESPEQAITALIKYAEGVTVCGVKYRSLHDACLAHKVIAKSVARRMEREHETAEQAIAAVKKLAEGVTVFGTNYPSIPAACRAHKVNAGSVASRMEQQGESLEQAITALIKYAEGVTVFGVKYPYLKAACLAHKVDATHASQRMKKYGESEEQAILYLVNRASKRPRPQVKLAKDIMVFGVKYPNLSSACRAHKVNFQSVYRRVKEENESPEHAIAAIKEFSQGVTVLGVKYPNLAAACVAHEVLRISVSRRVRKAGESPEQAILHMKSFYARKNMASLRW